jgi:hypothetical protein
MKIATNSTASSTPRADLQPTELVVGFAVSFDSRAGLLDVETAKGEL